MDPADKGDQNPSQILYSLTNSRINESHDPVDKYLTCLPLYSIIILDLNLDTLYLQLAEKHLESENVIQANVVV